MCSNMMVTLRNGEHIPAVGLGTWLAENDEELETAIDSALENGYRHIDTAFAYNNERIIGNVLKKWLSSGKLSRADIFITSKLPAWGNRPEKVEKYLKKTLELLQLDYLDLYLIHVPFAFKEKEGDYIFDLTSDNNVIFDSDVNHAELWKEMERMVDIGLAKSIGVSNFNSKQIQRLLDNSKIPPCVLQIEHHVYLQQPDLINFCKQNDIIVTAYSPLGSPGLTQLGKEVPNIMGNPTVVRLAEKYRKTPAQILLRHIIQKDITVIPKSVKTQRIKQNFDVFNFKLDSEDIEELNKLDNSLRNVDFEFMFKGIKKEPEYPFTELLD